MAALVNRNVGVVMLAGVPFVIACCLFAYAIGETDSTWVGWVSDVLRFAGPLLGFALGVCAGVWIDRSMAKKELSAIKDEARP